MMREGALDTAGHTANQTDQMQDQPNRRLVDLLYREILGRRADESGIAAYNHLLCKADRDAGIAASVRSLLSSNEYRNRPDHVAQFAHRALSPRGTRQINGKPVSHVVSLGTHCLAGFFVKQYGLKRYSLPFDWLFSSPDAVLHCLDDNFATFLDRSHYVSITERRATKEPGAEHRFYNQTYNVGDMFAHRDPLIPDDYRYVRDTVARFNAVMASMEAKLFVMIARPRHDAVRAFPLLSDKIRSTTENSAFICVQLAEPTQQVGCRSMNMLRSSGDHALYEFKPSSSELGLGFDEPLDDMTIMRLVWQYEFDLRDVRVPTD